MPEASNNMVYLDESKMIPEASNKVVSLDEYREKRAAEEREEKRFWTWLKNDIINFIISFKIKRGPIAPSEDIHKVLGNETIRGDELFALPSVKYAHPNVLQKLYSLLESLIKKTSNSQGEELAKTKILQFPGSHIQHTDQPSNILSFPKQPDNLALSQYAKNDVNSDKRT